MVWLQYDIIFGNNPLPRSFTCAASSGGEFAQLTQQHPLRINIRVCAEVCLHDLMHALHSLATALTCTPGSRGTNHDIARFWQ